MTIKVDWKLRSETLSRKLTFKVMEVGKLLRERDQLRSENERLLIEVDILKGVDAE